MIAAIEPTLDLAPALPEECEELYSGVADQMPEKPSLSSLDANAKLTSQRIEHAISITKWAAGLMISAMGALFWMFIAQSKDISRIDAKLTALVEQQNQLLPKLLEGIQKNPKAAAAETVHSLKLATILTNVADAPALFAAARQAVVITDLYPDLPETWMFAAAVANRRSVAYGTNWANVDLPACTESNWIPTEVHVDTPSKTAKIPARMQWCTLVLDGMTLDGNLYRHCIIRYSGGPITLKNVRFEDCRFEINVNEVPPPNGRQLQRLILAENSNNIAIGNPPTG